MLRGGDYEYFRGAPYQRGYGIGGMFRRFFKWIVPIVEKHAVPAIKEVGKTALVAAADIAKDAVSGRSLAESAKERLAGSIDNLREMAEKKLEGGGKRRNGKKSKTPKFIIVKKKKLHGDIFDRRV